VYSTVLYSTLPRHDSTIMVKTDYGVQYLRKSVYLVVFVEPWSTRTGWVLKLGRASAYGIRVLCR
jgi:hypothetical protein